MRHSGSLIMQQLQTVLEIKVLSNDRYTSLFGASSILLVFTI